MLLEQQKNGVFQTCVFTVFSDIATFWVSRPILIWVSPLGYYFESETAKIIGMSSKPRWWWRFLCSQSLHGIFRNKSFSSLRNVREWETSIYQTNNASFFLRNGERFPLLLETNNAFRIVTQTYFNSEHTIDFCVVKVFMVLLETKKKFLKLTKRPWVRNDYIPNEQRWILLLETNNVSLCC